MILLQKNYYLMDILLHPLFQTIGESAMKTLIFKPVERHLKENVISVNSDTWTG